MVLNFAKKNSVNITLLSLLFLSFVLMSFDVKHREKLSKLEELFVDSVAVTQKGASYSVLSFKELWLRYIYLSGLREENLNLKKEVGQLRMEVNSMREAALENERLRELLAYKEDTGLTTLTARVIGINPTNLYKIVTIGKGSSDGIARGMAVVTSDGIVGRVLGATSDSSRVLLITDRNSDVDALIQRSRDRGITEGADLGLLQLKYLPRSADVAEGDLLVTSGVGGIFPKGLVIGSISKLNRGSGGLFLSAEVKPAVNFSKLEEVLVITTSPKQL